MINSIQLCFVTMQATNDIEFFKTYYKFAYDLQKDYPKDQ